MDISKHSSFKQLQELIVDLAKDIPCEECKELKDQLNAAKSQSKSWETKYNDLLEKINGEQKVIVPWLLELLLQGKSLKEIDQLMSVSTYWCVENNQLVLHTSEVNEEPKIRIKVEVIESACCNNVDNDSELKTRTQEHE